MTTEKLVNKALFGKTELATQKVELTLADELKSSAAVTERKSIDLSNSIDESKKWA